MILLDTHTLVWLDEGSGRLGKQSRAAIDAALGSNELFIASISFWEIAMLAEKGRLQIRMDIAMWRNSLLEHGLQEVPLTGEIAVAAAQLADFHGDPADRIIAASARQITARLYTADDKILNWQQNVSRFDARE